MPEKEVGAVMILGTGVDIVNVGRIRESVERNGERFLGKLFLPAETEYCFSGAREYEHLAARFAAKEAFLKALGTGASQEAGFREIEVTRDERGRPGIRLHGRAAAFAAEKGVLRMHLSISHEKEFAIAQVVLEGRE